MRKALPLGNGKVTVIYRVTAIYRSTLQNTDTSPNAMTERAWKDAV